MELRQAIIESADRYFNPDNEYGHGIPDFYIADYRLANPQVEIPNPEDDVTFFPNPFTDELTLCLRGESYPVQVKINAYDAQGNTIGSQDITVNSKFIVSLQVYFHSSIPSCGLISYSATLAALSIV